MAKERHERVKELFQRARHLDQDARADYLAQTCAEDGDLRREVESLLAHHQEETLMATPRSPPSDTVPSAFRRATAQQPGTTNRLSAIGKAALQHKGRFVFGGVLLVLLVVFSFWTNDRVEQSLRDLLADHLQTVLDADVIALRQWLAAVETDAQMWASKRAVREAALELAELGDDADETAKELRDSKVLDSLMVTMAQAMRDPEAVASAAGKAGASHESHALLTHRRFDGFGVVSAGGRLVGGYSAHAETPERIGDMMTPRGMELLDQVKQGRTVVVPPYEHGSLIRGFVPSLKIPAMIVATPVSSESGEIVALLAFLIEPSEEYAAILEAARIGETGETYAFDERGVMLSESAFVDQLLEIGLLDDDAPSAVLQIQLRDPGVDLTKGFEPTRALADRPRTFMAMEAIDKKSSGVNVTGYRDYRGVDVAGAWTWLDEYGFGVATEIDLEEGYRAMDVLVTSLRILFWGVLLLTAGLTAFATKNISLQADVALARQYGDYRVERVLGEGGVGTVFLAEHKMFARPAAVKVLRKDRITRESEQRFQQEVQVTSQLTNPHTVQIYDFGKTTGGEFYYAMEYLPGLTLFQLVERYRAVQQERVVHIVRQICESLAEAHDLGIIHRDIKPMNILLCERGGRHDVVKVLDFGLVKDLGAPEDLQVTQSEEVTGSPLYMAPERFEAPLSVDARADIWAVGCVAYYLLAGRDPFSAKTVMEVWNKVANEDPPPLRTYVPTEVHPDLEALIRRCLAKDREERPQSVHEILATLHAIDLRAWTWKDSKQWWAERESELPHPPKIVRKAQVG